MTVETGRVITSTYAYHPADDIPDLYLPTEVVKRYHVAEMAHRLKIDPTLEWDIKQNGVLKPLKLYTNGINGVLGDGNHRLRVAVKLGIEELPVQILPDSLRRMSSQRGYPPLDSITKDWATDWLWSHTEHTVTRHIIGGKSAGGISPHLFKRCECSCGAKWREEA